MNNIAELNSNLERLNLLLGQVEQLADPSVRKTLEEILQGVMEFHAVAIARLLEIVGSRRRPACWPRRARTTWFPACWPCTTCTRST